MPKRLSKPVRRKPSPDPNVSAFRLVEHIAQAAKDAGKVVPMKRKKDPAAVALGRKGGRRSAEARMEKISAEDRHRIASNAARLRWERHRKADG